LFVSYSNIDLLRFGQLKKSEPSNPEIQIINGLSMVNQNKSIC
jgi:hypothetical protein